jgi:hypothetical protein
VNTYASARAASGVVARGNVVLVVVLGGRVGARAAGFAAPGLDALEHAVARTERHSAPRTDRRRIGAP